MEQMRLGDFLRMVRSDTDAPAIRFSIMNLISDINGQVVGIVNEGAMALGRKMITAIGGGALLSDQAAIENVGGFGFESCDAKFSIPIEMLEAFCELLEAEDGRLFEASPDREIHEELTEEIIPGIIDTPILPCDTCSLLNASYRGTSYGIKYGESKERDSPTIYIQRFFSLSGPLRILDALRANQAIVLFPEDIVDVYRMGEFEIGDNIRSALRLVYGKEEIVSVKN